ncbi:hypothetical protein OSB04_025466 [Centaurea solstitialis]|uniref:Cyanobacterial aminoacyl-tRNA synthetase CAAD domain-containing protein n=1 Tax=Centaurea solstitialis TaxID=347529 RepID=A0AA38SN54_9ASTR|nr:hypothetical protein OSB04_025466 [Centaurea solstitialis]
MWVNIPMKIPMFLLKILQIQLNKWLNIQNVYENPIFAQGIKNPRIGPGSKKSLAYRIKASSEDPSETSEVGEVFSNLKEKWDALENKPMAVVYGGGAAVGVWLSSTVVNAINSVPVVPKFMELIGFGYTGWFIYRYLLFKSGRKELADDIEVLKKKIIGSE